MERVFKNSLVYSFKSDYKMKAKAGFISLWPIFPLSHAEKTKLSTCGEEKHITSITL